MLRTIQSQNQHKLVPVLARSYSAFLEEELPGLSYKSINETPKVEVTTLSNGVKVASYDSHLPVARVSFFVNNAGSSSGPLSTALRAVFLESNDARSGFLSQRTLAQLGTEVQYTVAREYLQVETEISRDSAPEAVSLLSDALVSNQFNSWEMESSLGELTGLMNAMRNDSDRQLIEGLHSVSFRKGLAAPMVPAEHDVKKINSDALKEYAQQRFAGNNIVIVGVDVDHASLVASASKLSNLPKTTVTSEKDEFVGGRDLRVPAAGSSCSVILGFKGASLGSKESIAYALLRNALCSGPSVKWGDDHSKVAVNASAALKGESFLLSSDSISYNDTGIFCIEATAEAANMAPLLASVASTISETSTKGLAAGELARSKAILKSSLKAGTGSSMVEELGKQLMVKDSFTPLADILKQIDSVTEADIKSVAQNLKNPSMVAIGDLSSTPYLDELKL